MKEKTYVTMDYEEFDELVAKHFPDIEGYEFVADEEANNSSCYAFDEIDGWVKEKLDPWGAGKLQDPNNNQFLARLLLQDLCEKGLIPKGDYLIHVFW